MINEMAEVSEYLIRLRRQIDLYLNKYNGMPIYKCFVFDIVLFS